MVAVTVLSGDCREVLKTLPDESVHCVVTSPPYWGLREYAVPPLVWGGDPSCQHQWGDPVDAAGARSNDSSPGKLEGDGHKNRDRRPKSHFCVVCGAWRGQLGLEPTPQLYVSHLLDILRDVKRVLRSDGTLWLNIGSSYHAGGKTDSSHGLYPAFKPKDIVPTPWLVGLALQADGWWLRADIIWHKTNALPESVKDRPTRSHEYVLLLSKSATYFYDYLAVAEEALYDGRKDTSIKGSIKYADPSYGSPDRGRERWPLRKGDLYLRNRRDVWQIPTAGVSAAHFAIMPARLAEVCILAGCPEGGTVLDPFAGSGTVGVAALRLRRNAILIELSEEYVTIASSRLHGAQEALS